MIVAVLIVVIIVFYVFSSKKRKKQEQDAQDLINAVKPGNKVKTIGGICGIVVEVDKTFTYYALIMHSVFFTETRIKLFGKVVKTIRKNSLAHICSTAFLLRELHATERLLLLRVKKL